MEQHLAATGADTYGLEQGDRVISFGVATGVLLVA